MNRFFGMMPSSEIEIEKSFKERTGTTMIQAGKNGWTILYPDGSSQYEDTVDSVENNYEKALNVYKQENDI